MKPAWDKLAEECVDSETTLIADVDCTTDKAKNLCQKYGVQGYPTIKYFTSNPMGDAYNGGRDFDSLKKWAAENLGPVCSPGKHEHLCTDEQKKEMDDIRALSESELDDQIAEHEKDLKDSDQTLKDLLESLQKQYNDGQKAKEAKEAEVQPKLGMKRKIKAAKSESGEGEL